VPEPPPPAPPTEAELREQLHAALDVQREADAAAQQAEQAHERGQQHLTRCQHRCADFVGLDSELSDATAAALRRGADPALPDELASRIAERDRAQTELRSAEQAVAVLLAERAAAARKAGDAAKVVETLTVRLLGFAAERIAEEWRTLTAETKRRRTALLGYDRLMAGKLLPLPLAVRHALGEVTGREAADIRPWRAAGDALRADPEATVEIELPALMLPPLPRQTAWTGQVVHHVAIARPAVEEAPPSGPQPPDDGDPYLADPTEGAA
jgi:hypothetical protein